MPVAPEVQRPGEATGEPDARIDQPTAVDFSKLPLMDALVRGWLPQTGGLSGPNCGHCNRLQATLEATDSLTVYLFAKPMLGDDAVTKARDI